MIPSERGLIASFARPGGNITGLTYSDSTERFAKELQGTEGGSRPHLSRRILWRI